MESSHTHGRRAYFVNIAWSWLGFVVMFLSAGIVMPVLIRHLGTARFGIWALASSLVEYFWLIDLGFRPATVKLSAEFRAVNRLDEVNRLINTGLAYTATAGGLILLFGWFGAGRVATVLHIADPDFPFLLRAVGVAWAGGLIFNVFAAVLEGFQRFDLSTRSAIVAAVLRVPANLAVAISGRGLRDLAIVLVTTQFLAYGMTYYYCRRVHPEMRMSPSLVSRRMAREIFKYAGQIVSSLLGSRLSQASIPALIAYFDPVRFVTYFTQSQRILDYLADIISRVGMVTAPRVSDWWARGWESQVADLVRHANRYCLILWGLPAAYLFVYGGAFCRVWVNQEFGDRAAVLLPVMLVGYTFWMGQFVSAAVLMGIGRYTTYSVALLVEAVLEVAGVALVLPRFGLIGAAVVVSTGMFVARFVILSRLLTDVLKIGHSRFLWDVFSRPLTLIVISIAALTACRSWLWSGRNWTELLGVGCSYSILYIAIALAFAVEGEHRALVFERAAGLWKRRLALPT